MEKFTNLFYIKDASNNNTSFIIDMVNIFLRQTPEFLQQMKDYQEKGDWENFRKIVHKFKPTVGMMGIDLNSQISRIEECSKSLQNLEEIGPLVDDVRRICEESYKELAVEIKSL